MHLSWAPSDIAAIFYVNDSLSMQLVGGRWNATDRGTAASQQTTAQGGAQAVGSLASLARTRALAAHTKLLPRGLRRAPHDPDLAHQLQVLSLQRAAKAHATALRVQRWLRSHLGLLAHHRSVEPLPVLQYRVSRECFDMHAVMARVHRRGDSSSFAEETAVLSVPPTASGEACTSRVDGLLCPQDVGLPA